jgi:hypothetical protein
MKTPDPKNTRGAMDPPTRPLFLLSRIAIALAITLPGAGIYALAAWTMPTLGWLWPIGVSTLVLTVVILIGDLLAEAD